MYTKATFEERNTRYGLLRAAMEREGMKAMVIAGKGHWWTGRGYWRWLTDFHLHGHDGLLLLPLEGEPMLTLTSANMANKIALVGWVTDVCGDPDIAPEMVKEMKRRGLTKGKIGLVGQHFILPAIPYHTLVSSLPDVDWVDADNLMDRARMIRSRLEIQQNVELWELATSAMERFVEALEPGRTQLELAAEAVKVAYTGGARDFLVSINGETPSDRIVELEDVISFHMEIAGPSGHCCELTITAAYRDPTPLEQKLADDQMLARQEMYKMARPGVRLSEMARTFERVMLDCGWEFTGVKNIHYDFHGQGLDWMEFPFYGETFIREDIPVESGMSFSCHPSRYLKADVRSPGYNENILITEDGAVPFKKDWDMRWRLMT